MKKRTIFIPVFSLIAAFFLLFSSVALSACGNAEATSWDVSVGVKAYFSDNGKHGYVLNIEGAGEIPSYNSKKDAPWYPKSGRITQIKISDGITSLGANAFTDIKTSSVVLPASVKAVGEGCFNEQVMICAYSPLSAPAGTDVYLYSETQPSGGGKFWHFDGGVAVRWKDAGVKRILFIGNSFTYYNDMPSIFASVAEGAGASVEVDSITKGSQTLTNWVNPENEDGAKLKAKLESGDYYDCIVIQEQSTRPLNNYSLFLSAAKTLVQMIENTQTDCKIYLYSTWGYAKQAESRGITVPQMEAQLRSAYENVAAETGAEVSYVGKAFSYVYENRKDINLYNADDNMHPSYAGSYLAACVHVATVLGIDPTSSAFDGSLDKATAEYLRSTAKTN